jgi:hypothetical protein
LRCNKLRARNTPPINVWNIYLTAMNCPKSKTEGLLFPLTENNTKSVREESRHNYKVNVALWTEHP